MSKTTLTKNIEKKLCDILVKKGEYPCLEVTAGIGWSKDGRVDIMSVDSKSSIRCFEIKVSKADFLSNAKKTFVGNYNYYAMPENLFEKVKEFIPNDIGVYLFNETTKNIYCLIKAKNKNISIEKKNNLLLSMVRSMTRDVSKLNKIEDDSEYKKLSQRYKELEKEQDETRKKLVTIENSLLMALGSFNWKDELDFANFLIEKSKATLKFTLQPINDKKELEDIKNTSCYHLLDKLIKKYLKTQKVEDYVIDWFSFLYANSSKETIINLLKELRYTRDNKFKCVLNKEENEEIEKELTKYNEIQNRPFVPFLPLKERNTAINNSLAILEKTLIEDYKVSKSVVLGLMNNIPYKYVNKEAKETYYFILQQGKDVSKYCNKILCIYKKEKNNTNMWKTSMLLSNRQKELFNNCSYLDVLTFEECHPIQKNEIDFIFSQIVKDKAITYTELNGYFHLNEEIPTNFII